MRPVRFASSSICVNAGNAKMLLDRDKPCRRCSDVRRCDSSLHPNCDEAPGFEAQTRSSLISLPSLLKRRRRLSRRDHRLRIRSWMERLLLAESIYSQVVEGKESHDQSRWNWASHPASDSMDTAPILAAHSKNPGGAFLTPKTFASFISAISCHLAPCKSVLRRSALLRRVPVKSA